MAARANLLTVDQMLDRLRTGRPSYGAPTDAPERQRSLVAALEWSHGLLGTLLRKTLPEAEVARFISAGRQLRIDEAADLAAADMPGSPTVSH